MIEETKPHGYGCHITACGGQRGIFTLMSLVWENLEDLSLF